MIASLGMQVRHHFKHKNSADGNTCSVETYLHQMGKTLLAETLREDKAQNRCLFVSTPGDAVEVHDLSGNTLGVFRETNETEILYASNDISIEKGYKGFVADVLVSFQSGLPVMFEVAVSHRCELEKIKSGARIVEFLIKDEQDIERMRDVVRSGKIVALNDTIVLHGFPLGEACRVYAPQPVNAEIARWQTEAQESRKRYEKTNLELSLLKDRFTKLQTANDALEERIAEKTGLRMATAFLERSGAVFLGDPISRPRGEWEEFYFPEPEKQGETHRYDAAVRQAARLWPGRVRSCLLCESHAFNTGDKPMFCFKTRTKMRQGQASSCRGYEEIQGERLSKKRKYLMGKARNQRELDIIPA